MFIKRVAFTIFVLLLASPAFGRKGSREGFNFGTSLRLMGVDGTTSDRIQPNIPLMILNCPAPPNPSAPSLAMLSKSF